MGLLCRRFCITIMFDDLLNFSLIYKGHPIPRFMTRSTLDPMRDAYTDLLVSHSLTHWKSATLFSPATMPGIRVKSLAVASRSARGITHPACCWSRFSALAFVGPMSGVSYIDNISETQLVKKKLRASRRILRILNCLVDSIV